MENGDLIIRNLKWADMGGYTCHVSNSEGSDETLVFLYPTLVRISFFLKLSVLNIYHEVKLDITHDFEHNAKIATV